VERKPDETVDVENLNPGCERFNPPWNLLTMPFPSDETIMETSRELVAQLQGIFGKHPGFRPGLSQFPLSAVHALKNHVQPTQRGFSSREHSSPLLRRPISPSHRISPIHPRQLLSGSQIRQDCLISPTRTPTPTHVVLQ